MQNVFEMLARINIHSPGKSWKRVRWKDFSLLLVPNKSTLKKIYKIINARKLKSTFLFSNYSNLRRIVFPRYYIIFYLTTIFRIFPIFAFAKIHKSSHVDRALENVQTLKWRDVAAWGSKWSLARPVYEYFKRTPCTPL